jgi:hypothetical protein
MPFLMSAGNFDSGGFTDFAWLLVRVIAILLALLLAQILGLRALLARRKRHQSKFRAEWAPLLATVVDSYPPRLPRLARRDVVNFLLIWNFYQESLRDVARQRLNRVARRLNIDRAAIRLIRRRGIRDRLIALTAIGHLGEASAWATVAGIAEHDEAVLSLSAARALLRMDARRGAEFVVALMSKRTDWPAASLATMLAEAGPDAISAPLVRAAAAAHGAEAPRVIRLLELVHVDAASPVIHDILENSTDAEAVTACLRVVQDPALLALVRLRTTDERWEIRLHAVQALGRMGSRADEWHLIRALQDPHWWVRYRAARALAKLPAMDAGRLHRLSGTVEDRYGRDMLRQVIAEQELAC